MLTLWSLGLLIYVPSLSSSKLNINLFVCLLWYPSQANSDSYSYQCSRMNESLWPDSIYMNWNWKEKDNICNIIKDKFQALFIFNIFSAYFTTNAAYQSRCTNNILLHIACMLFLTLIRISCQRSLLTNTVLVYLFFTLQKEVYVKRFMNCIVYAAFAIRQKRLLTSTIYITGFPRWPNFYKNLSA